MFFGLICSAKLNSILIYTIFSKKSTNDRLFFAQKRILMLLLNKIER
jgi:hypothetical protein